MVDWQSAFNILFALFGAVGGYVMKVFHDEIKDNREELQKLPSVYARRDDMKDMKIDIMEALRRIEHKVDGTHGKG